MKKPTEKFTNQKNLSLIFHIKGRITLLKEQKKKKKKRKKGKEFWKHRENLSFSSIMLRGVIYHV